MWVELARAYATLGLPKPAERAISIALRLARENRYVLRCAARFFIHQNDLVRAHDLLRRSDSVRADPWLLSAEIAVANAASRVSNHIRSARAMLEGRRIGPFDLSELGSALATTELEAGKTKHARRLFRRSLERPSENSIAQAAWAQRRFGVSIVDPGVLEGGSSSEATAWAKYQDGEWQLGLEHAKRWLDDQPFSSRPATFGSYIASVCLASYDECAGIARRGLMANPNNFLLLNNLTFGLAQMGQVHDAEREIGRINPEHLPEQDRVVWTATRGLVQYRLGHFETGKALYREAVQLASDRRDRRRLALASIFFAMEELRARGSDGGALRAEALARCEGLPLPELDVLAARLRSVEWSRQ
ncbi:MAG: hypothetical protein C4547_15415 [Phycisphaerales bacterium]|nr:MAG: hypothetical protein C4547_15415 [Phycisphaerales bacterium]